MCTTEPAGSGPNLGPGLAAIALIAGAGIAYSFFVAHPVGTVLTFLAFVVVAVGPLRRGALSLTGAGLVALWRLAFRRRPGRQVAVARAWQVVVYRPAGGTNEVLTRGVVEGTWSTSKEVEAETIHRAVEHFGWAQAGDLRAHAVLVDR